VWLRLARPTASSSNSTATQRTPRVPAFERDRARDRALHAAGWRVLRITWRQLHREADAVAADLGVLLRSAD